MNKVKIEASGPPLAERKLALSGVVDGEAAYLDLQSVDVLLREWRALDPHNRGYLFGGGGDRVAIARRGESGLIVNQWMPYDRVYRTSFCPIPCITFNVIPERTMSDAQALDQIAVLMSPATAVHSLANEVAEVIRGTGRSLT